MDIDEHKSRIFRLCDKIAAREAERASDTGEDREEIGSLLDFTGINKIAFAFIRKLDKMESDKRDDVLRSLGPLQTLFEPRWNGASTPDMFGAGGDDSNVTPLRPDFDQRDDFAGVAAQ